MRAAEGGRSKALLNIADLHGRAGRHEEAIKWYREAAAVGDIGAMNAMIDYYQGAGRLAELTG